MFGKLRTLIRGRRFIWSAPQFVRCFLRNRLRSASLLLDARRPSGASLPPQGITVRLTLRCNLRCKMCRFVAEAPAPGECREFPSLPYPTAAKVAAQASALGAHVSLSGGEPLLYERLPEVIASAKGNGGTCGLITNGLLLERRAAEVAQASPDLMVTSLLGPPAIHDEITGFAGSFERLATGVHALRSALDGNGRTAIALNCTISSANAGHLRELVDLVRDWPIDALNLQHLWFTTPEMLRQHERRFGWLFEPCFSETCDDGATRVEGRMVAEELASVQAHHPPFALHVFPDLSPDEVQRYYDAPSRFVGPRRALCAWRFCEVTPTGEVSPCQGYTAGSVADASLMEIWNGPRLRAFRRALFEARAFPICARCCGLFRRD